MALSNFEFVTGKLEKHIHCITISGEGHGNPLQYSCLENPKDRGAWWESVGSQRVRHN